MVYRVFISNTFDEKSSDFIHTVQHALWHLKDFPVSPMTMEDRVLREGNPEALIRQTIDDTDIFIGIYGSTYGEYKHLNVADLIEYEYMYATQRGIPTLVFMPEADTGDERLRKFKQSIKSRQIVHSFISLEDLEAKLVLSITNVRQLLRQSRVIIPPQTALSPSREDMQVVESDFEIDVRRAFNLVEDDIEGIIQRALATQSARNNLPQSDLKGGAGHEIMVNPIFGEPNRNVQFQSDIFMIMPFRAEYDEIYQNMIVSTVHELNLTIKRGDEFSSVSGQIMSEVWAAINACRLVIVETSEENANVYYELGIAHTLGKPAILITQAKDIEDFPFDIRHLRFIVYENTIAGGEKLEADLKQSIIWILNDLEDGL